MKTGILKSVIGVLGLFFLSLGLFLFWAVGKNLAQKSNLEIEVVNALPIYGKHQITLLSYNIGHGQGIKNQPTDWRDEEYTRKKMAELTQVIESINPDIIAMQEVDIDAHRTHHINEAQWIADAGHYPYRACALVWDENYIPYPFWPISHQLGSIKSANCILSRFPLSKHRRFLFQKPSKNPFWYNWAYLDRGAQSVKVTVGSKHFILLNVHLEAFDKNTRQKQAHELVELLKKIKAPVLLTGDFNSVPAEANQKHNFKGEPEADFREDHSIAIIRSALGDDFDEGPMTGHTFPADKPNQRLDATFAFNGLHILSSHVVEKAQDASDHLPILSLLSF